jgi:hypothetical protein
VTYDDAYSLRPGERIHFTGGTGRNDDAATYAATVNGEPYTLNPEHVCYVPVHIQAINHNVAVAHSNIVEKIPS